MADCKEGLAVFLWLKFNTVIKKLTNVFDVLARRGALLSQDFVVYLETLPELSFFSQLRFCRCFV